MGETIFSRGTLMPVPSIARLRAVQQIVACKTWASEGQIGFYRKRPFAATWMPGRHLKGDVAPLVLSISLRHRNDSRRWKKVVEPAPGRFTHHMELHSAGEVDDVVKDALADAWHEAG